MAASPDYVTLISNDGFEFKVQRSSACLSGAIKRMLDPTSQSYSRLLLYTATNIILDGFAESKTHTCVFENIKYVPTFRTA